MLNEHLLDRVIRKVRIDGGAAELGKTSERLGKRGIFFSLLADEFFEIVSEIVNAFFETLDRLFPLNFHLGPPAEEILQAFYQRLGFCEIVFADHRAIAIEHGPLRRLKENIRLRISGLEFFRDFFFQVVVRIFCFPISDDDPHVSHNGAIDGSGVPIRELPAIFGNERPLAFGAELAGAEFQQVGERITDDRLFRESVLLKFSERFVISANRLLSGLEIEMSHNGFQQK